MSQALQPTAPKFNAALVMVSLRCDGCGTEVFGKDTTRVADYASVAAAYDEAQAEAHLKATTAGWYFGVEEQFCKGCYTVVKATSPIPIP
jgi:hypothetical protein